MSEEARIIEAILFSAGRAVSLGELKELTGFDENLILASLEKLSSKYNQASSALELSRAAEKYAMQVKVKYSDKVTEIAPKEIPERLLKTLALIAYHQPILQVELLKLIGSKVYDHVRELHELGMIRTRAKGRTKILTTTKLFPEYFGIGTTKREEIKKYLSQEVKI